MTCGHREHQEGPHRIARKLRCGIGTPCQRRSKIVCAKFFWNAARENDSSRNDGLQRGQYVKVIYIGADQAFNSCAGASLSGLLIDFSCDDRSAHPDEFLLFFQAVSIGFYNSLCTPEQQNPLRTRRGCRITFLSSNQ